MSDSRIATAYRLYVAMQHGAGMHGTSRGPYPVRTWQQLPQHRRDWHLRQAMIFHALGDAVPLPRRLYLSWWCDHQRPDGMPAVVAFERLTLGRRAFWLSVADAYWELQEGQEAA